MAGVAWRLGSASGTRVRVGGAKGRPGGARGVPQVDLAAGAPWTRSTGGVRRAAGETEHREERDGGEGVFVISEIPGTSR